MLTSIDTTTSDHCIIVRVIAQIFGIIEAGSSSQHFTFFHSLPAFDTLQRVRNIFIPSRPSRIRMPLQFF